MKLVLSACLNAMRSLLRPGVLWHLMWPTLLAALLWTVVGALSWSALIGMLTEGVQGLGWGAFGAALAVTVKIAVLLAFFPLVYLTAAVLVAVVALPLMLDRVGREDYADLEQRQGGSNAGSFGNALLAVLMFCAVGVLTLPLWLLPGAGIVISVGLTAWLNQRVFGYDALMRHADTQELTGLRQTCKREMLWLGVLCGVLAYVPLLNLVVPAWCGLAFVHLMLGALRRERVERGVSLLDPAATPARLPIPGA